MKCWFATARDWCSKVYVERNLSFIKQKYKPGNYEEIINQFELNLFTIYKKEYNNGIIENEIKYKIEVELYELKEKLENEGINEIEIENKIKIKKRWIKNKLLKNQNDFINKKESKLEKSQKKNK